MKKDKDFTDDFLKKVAIGKNKGVSAEVVVSKDNVIVVCSVGMRKVGKFFFNKDETGLFPVVKHTVEREYFPFEVALYELKQYLKSKKIKALLVKENFIFVKKEM